MTRQKRSQRQTCPRCSCDHTRGICLTCGCGCTPKCPHTCPCCGATDQPSR